MNQKSSPIKKSVSALPQQLVKEFTIEERKSLDLLSSKSQECIQDLAEEMQKLLLHHRRSIVGRKCRRLP